MRALFALWVPLLGILLGGGVAEGRERSKPPRGPRPPSVSALSKKPPDVGAEIEVTAYVVFIARCAPCAPPRDCRPCSDEFLLLGDRPDAKSGLLLVHLTHAQQQPLARGQRRAFTLRFSAASAGPREGPIRRGVQLVTSGPALPRPRPQLASGDG